MKASFRFFIPAIITVMFCSCVSTPKNDGIESQKTTDIPPKMIQSPPPPQPDTTITDKTGSIEHIIKVPEKETEQNQIPEEPKVYDLPPETAVPVDSVNPETPQKTAENNIQEPVVNELKPAAHTKMPETEIAPTELPETIPVLPQAIPAPAPIPVPEKTTPRTQPEQKTEKIDSGAAPAELPKITEPAPQKIRTTEKSSRDNNKKEEDNNKIGKEKTVEPEPSRSVSADIKQYIDVAYPGRGWVYLGETDSDNRVTFVKRTYDQTNTLFTLQAKTPGTALLHFYKTDILTGQYIDDYLKVTVNNTKSDGTERVTAPVYADIVPVKQERKVTDLPPVQEQKPAEKKESAVTVSEPVNGKESQAPTPQPQNSQNDNTTQAAESPDDILKAAQKTYESKDYPQTLKLLDKFLETATKRIDEGLFLRGETLEQKSTVQNVKKAIEAYDTIVKNWPDSSLWQNANERSIYLKQFYINIR